MEIFLKKIVALGVIFMALHVPALADEKVGPGISRDPFAPPDLRTAVTSMEQQERGRSREEVIQAEAAGLVLRATIRTEHGDWGLANINGTMLEQGEKIDGFSLERIGETDAMVRKDGVEVVLYMESTIINLDEQ